MSLSDLTIEGSLALFVKRTEFYLNKGYNRTKAVQYVANCRKELTSHILEFDPGNRTIALAHATMIMAEFDKKA